MATLYPTAGETGITTGGKTFVVKNGKMDVPADVVDVCKSHGFTDVAPEPVKAEPKK